MVNKREFTLPGTIKCDGEWGRDAGDIKKEIEIGQEQDEGCRYRRSLWKGSAS